MDFPSTHVLFWGQNDAFSSMKGRRWTRLSILAGVGVVELLETRLLGLLARFPFPFTPLHEQQWGTARLHLHRGLAKVRVLCFSSVCRLQV